MTFRPFAFRRSECLKKVSLGHFRAFDSPPVLVSGSHSLIMVLPTVPMPVWIRLVLLFRHACGTCFILKFVFEYSKHGSLRFSCYMCATLTSS